MSDEEWLEVDGDAEQLRALMEENRRALENLQAHLDKLRDVLSVAALKKSPPSDTIRAAATS